VCSNVADNALVTHTDFCCLVTHFWLLTVAEGLLHASTYRSATIPHDWHSRVRTNDPSRSAEINDFCVVWKGLFDLLLVINSNLGPISHSFWDRPTASFRLKTHIFPTPFQCRLQFNSKFENVPLTQGYLLV